MKRHFTLDNLTKLSAETGRWEKGSLSVSGGCFVEASASHRNHIDCTNLYAIPGLVDVHTHIFGESDPKKAVHFSWMERESKALKRAAVNAAEFLRFGITTIRDLGGHGTKSFTLKNLISQGKVRSPRFVTAGEFITTAARTDHAFGRIIEPSRLIDTVSNLCSCGADWIKIINDPIDFEITALSAAVKCAHAQRRPVAVHAFTEEATLLALNAGVDSIEHSAVGWKSVLTHLRASDVFFVPTLTCSTDVVENPAGSLIKDKSLIAIFRKWNREQRHLVPLTIDTPLRIAVGTDTGFPPTSPGSSLHREMQLLTDIGFSPLSVLFRTTALNADLLRMPSIGRLSPGCHADFVLADGNPENIGALSKAIISVFLGGKCVFGNNFHQR
jgi:imidazolonepropionase-like amidohydrolase